MKIILIALLIALATPLLHSQPIPNRLPNLCWIAGTAAHTPALEATTDFGDVDFSFGWNWAAPYDIVGQRMHARRWHVSDYFNAFPPPVVPPVAVPDDMQRVFGENYVPRMQFISVVRGVSDGLLGNNHLSNPSEAPAIEFWPWMNYNASSQDVDLDPSDHNGCVFGFRLRNGGVRTGNGSDPNSQIPMPYRWHFTATPTAPAGMNLVLDGPTTDDQMRFWWPNRNPANVAPANRLNDLNTMVLRVAITLRRTDADPVGTTANDVVLSVRLPYTLGNNVIPIDPDDRINNQNVRFIEFNRFPLQELPPMHNAGTYQRPGDPPGPMVPSGRLSRMQIDPIDPADQFTTFNITLGMLPALGDAQGEEVTVFAEFLCDRQFIDPNTTPITTRNNHTVQQAKRSDPNNMSHLGIEVRHNSNSATGIGVEIRSIRIETPHATRVLFGDFDNQIQNRINDYVNMVDSRLNVSGVNNFNSPVVNLADRVRIWRFYGRDEAEVMHWLAFRRLNTLLDGHLMTEVGAELIDKQNHGMGQSIFWQGAGFNASSSIAAYQYQRGFDIWGGQQIPILDIRRHAGLKFGLLNMRMEPQPGIVYFDDPDTFLEGRDKANGPQVLPIREDEDVSNYLEGRLNSTGGIIANLEAVMRKNHARERNMLFGIHATNPTLYVPWIANTWPQSYIATLAGGTSDIATYHWATFENNRALSHTEMRLAFWMPIVLGSKGVMVYKGIGGTEDGGALPLDPITAARQRAGEDWRRNYETGMLAINRANFLTNTAGSTPDQVIDNDVIGSDWMFEADQTNVPRYFVDRPLVQNPLSGFQEIIQTLNNGVPPAAGQDRLYVGQRSMRQTFVEVTDQVERMRNRIGRFLNPTPAIAHPLTSLRLRGWYGKGFSTIEETHPQDPTCLQRVFGVNNHILPRLRTRHPRRIRDLVVASNVPGHYDYEPVDSSFVDLTLHAFVGEEAMNTRFVVGVLNRRTDPRMMLPGTLFNSNTDAGWLFTTYQEWRDRVVTDVGDRFAQRGAREVTVPFSYSHPDGRYRLLRIREMGGGVDQANGSAVLPGGIDTVIGQDRELTISMLPGEGKMLQVEVLRADDVVHTNPQNMSRGFLDQNTQRKLVHFPQVTDWNWHTEPKPACADAGAECLPRTYMRTENGSTMRYHLVYHRRADPNLPFAIGNPLDVFYQRSVLMPIRCNDEADCVDLGSIEWEDPITLNSYIVDTIIGGDTTLITPPNRPSCGYPSVVVRYDINLTPARSRVYVVYSCEEDNPLLRNVVIYEAQLDADVTAELQTNNYTRNEGRSRRLGRAQSSSACPNEERLRFWGTPVVNASNFGNYYAWSCYTDGIVYAFKPPVNRIFNPLFMKKMKVGNGAGTKAQFPTLNTYSRLHIGEEECALAWQEGRDERGCEHGDKIYYTQLRWTANGISKSLHSEGTLNMANNPPVPTFLPTTVPPFENTVALISMAGTDMNVKPTLLRSLTDFEQSGFTLQGTQVCSVGLVRHKADRVFWTNQVEQPFLRESRIARRAVDVVEFAKCTSQEVGTFWTGTVGYIVGTTDLHSVEVSAGEAKTTLYGDPDVLARSWLYDDTLYVINFNQYRVPQTAPFPGYIPPSIWHVAFGWRFMGSNALGSTMDDAQSLPPDPPYADLKNLAFVHLNSIGGRFPHSSTSYSQSFASGTTTFGMTAGRRVFEAGNFDDSRWNLAPNLWRSAEGFYKDDGLEVASRTNASVASRFFVGFRGGNFDAMLTDVKGDGKPIFNLVTRNPHMEAGSKRVLFSDWVHLPSSLELTVSSMNSGDAYDNSNVYIERRSDGTRLELPVFSNENGLKKAAKKSRDFRWPTIANLEEQFRLVIECSDDEAGVAVDIELEPEVVTFAKSDLTRSLILDLTKMRTISSESDQSADVAIVVNPNPANETLSVIVVDNFSSSPHEIYLSTIDGRTVLTIPNKFPGSIVADVDVRGLSAGVYVVGIEGTPVRKLLVISR